MVNRLRASSIGLLARTQRSYDAAARHLDIGPDLPAFCETMIAAWVLAATVGSASPHIFELESGLKVILEPMPRAHTVAVVVGYPVGSSGGPPGRRGLTHLVEHLVLRRAGRLGPFAGTDHVESHGGEFNGLTYPDRTIYYSVLPPEALETALFFERERLAFSRDFVTADDLAKEQAIVARELELRGGFGARVERVRLGAFLEEGSPWIASPKEKEEVQRHTLEEVRWFLERYYRPDHAVLAVAGRMDVDRTRRFIERGFGTLARPSDPLPRPPPARVDAPVDRRLVVERSDTAEELRFLWLRARRATTSERAVATEVVKRVLTAFARRHEDVIHRSGVSFYALGPLQALVLRLEGEGSKSLETLEDGLRAEIEKLVLELPERIDAPEMAKARREVELAFVRNHAAPLPRARRAVDATLLGEPVTVAAVLDEIRTLSPERMLEILGYALNEAPLVERHLNGKSAKVELEKGSP